MFPRVTWSTRNNSRGWPIRCRHLVWRYDAKHKAVCLNGAFGGYTDCRASTAANDSDANTRERLPRLPGEIVSARARFGAPEYTYLGLTMAMNHTEAYTHAIFVGEWLVVAGQRYSRPVLSTMNRQLESSDSPTALLEGARSASLGFAIFQHRVGKPQLLLGATPD
jgi:hypothetical protein